MDWAIYEIMKGVLANYRHNQSKRRQRCATPEKNTLSVRADHELQAEGNDEIGDRNPEDDGTTILEDDSETEDTTAGEMEGDRFMEDENDLDGCDDYEDEIPEDDGE